MDYIIYSYGGGEILEAVFNAIALMFNGNGKDSIFMQISKLTAILGMFCATWMMVLKRNPLVGYRWLATYFLITEVLLIPTVTVRIKDVVVTGYERPVANVPIGLALVASMMSQIGYIVTREMETNFTPLNDFMYHKTGFVFGSHLIANMSKMSITNADFARTMTSFVDRCVIMTAMTGRDEETDYGYTIEELRTSSDAWQLIKDNAHQLIMFPYTNPNDGVAKIVTCAEGVELIEKHLKEEVRKSKVSIFKAAAPNLFFRTNKKLGGNPQYLNGQLEGYIHSALTSFTQISDNAEKALKQQMVVNAIRDSSNILIGNIGMNYAISKAELHRGNQLQTKWLMLKTSMPLMRGTLEAVLYGSFFIVALISRFFGGWMILIRYFKTLGWLQLWPPMDAIINMIVVMNAQKQTSNLMAGKGITIANSLGLSQIHQETCWQAQNLSAMIPFIALAIICGVQLYSHLASQLTGTTQAAASSAAADITSGNIHVGNIQHKVRAIKTMNAFQHMSSSNYDSGSHTQNLPDGSLERKNPDGSTTYTNRNISKLGTTISSTESTTQSLNKAISDEKNVVEGRNKEFTQTQQEAKRQIVDFLEKIVNGINSGENYGVDESTTSGKAINKAVNLQKQLTEKFGVSSNQASKILAGVTASGGSKGQIVSVIRGALEANFGASYDSTASREQAVSDMTDLIVQSGYSETLDSLSRASKDLKYGENQGEEKALSESLSASVEKMRSLREANSVSEQKIARWNEGKSFVKSNSVSINRDNTQQFLNYLATREQHGRKIGLDTARKMIETWTPETQMYANYFKQDVLAPQNQEFVQRIAKGKIAIENQYDSTTLKQPNKQQEVLKSQGALETITKYGKSQVKSVQNQHLKNEGYVENRIKTANEKIDRRRVKNLENKDKMQHRADKSYKKNILYKATKNAVWSPDKKKTLEPIEGSKK